MPTKKSLLYIEIAILFLMLNLGTPITLRAADLQINEFMALNDRSYTDPQDENDDWIEIHNTTSKAIDLAGYYLSDDVNNPTLWQVPDNRPKETTLAAGGYLIIWADGDITDEGLHASFRLNSRGETLLLTDRDGKTLLDSVRFERQAEDISYGRIYNAPILWGFFDNPSPNRSNSAGYLGLVADTKFSQDRGFYDDPITVEITCETPEAKIYYTMDGSSPYGAARGGRSLTAQLYTEPLVIDTTTCLRAVAVQHAFKPSNVDTHTYLFLEDVIRQPRRPSGFSSGWGHNGGDYEMDPEVVDDPLYRDRMRPALEALPSLSLVMDHDDWFGSDGIYTRGELQERAVSAEWLLPSGEPGFQIDAAVMIVGGSSTTRWKMDKLSMRLKFQSAYGSPKLRYPVFGEGATDEFDTLVVDARMNNTWAYGGGVRVYRDGQVLTQRDTAQYTRDQYVADLQNAAGGWAPHGRGIHLYLNGLYWGIYCLHERPDEHFAAAYLGGEDEDYEVIKHSPGNVVNGSGREYLQLRELVDGNVQSASQYNIVEEVLDVRNFIDYMLINYYVGNWDWDRHNWYASYNKNDPLGRWQFHTWDAEHVMEALYENVTNRDRDGYPGGIHHRLMTNDTYRSIFEDRVTQHFFNGGLLTPEGAIAHYQVRLDELDLAIVAESARWGDNHRTTPYTRDIDWVAERDWLLETYFPQRTEVVLQQLRSRGWYP